MKIRHSVYRIPNSDCILKDILKFVSVRYPDRTFEFKRIFDFEFCRGLHMLYMNGKSTSIEICFELVQDIRHFPKKMQLELREKIFEDVVEVTNRW